MILPVFAWRLIYPLSVFLGVAEYFKYDKNQEHPAQGSIAEITVCIQGLNQRLPAELGA